MRRRLGLPLLAGVVAAAAAFAVTAAMDDGASPRPAAAARPTVDGGAVFARMGCGSCHQLAAAGSTGEMGPSLDQRLPAHTRASLREAIVSPPPGAMPEDFATRLGPAELDALVGFLLAARGGG